MASSAIDAAVIAALANDATLTGLAPGGVYRDIAPQGVSRPFVVVTLQAHEDALNLGRAAAFERATFLVKAVDANTSGTTAQAIADRIQVLLQNAALSITGYRCVDVHREERIAFVETEDNGDRKWQHRGGLYVVMAEAS